LTVLGRIPKEGEDAAGAEKIVIRIEGRRSLPNGTVTDNAEEVEGILIDGEEDMSKSAEQVIAELLVRIGFTDPENQEIDFEATLKALIDGVAPKEPKGDEEIVVPALLDLIRVRSRRVEEVSKPKIYSSLEEAIGSSPPRRDPWLN